jgi:hypothetical protein
MAIDCVVYISSVLNPKKHARKIQCLESFAAGVAAAGATVKTEWDYKYTPSRLAVMLGWATTNTGGQNIVLRKRIISEQQRRSFKTMCIDASCFKYLDDHGTYLRYSLGGPFYDRAEYANRNSTDVKWQEIKQQLGIQLKPTRMLDSGNILICMQRDGGFSMKALDPMTWLHQKIKQIRAVTNRPIVIRPHPGKYNMADFAAYHTLGKNLVVIDPLQSKLVDNLQSAHSAVFFNSSASVAAVCEGVPIFVDDSSCVSWAVANKDIALIESPKMFDRDQWMWDLSSAHWSDHNGRSGDIWKKFQSYL